MANPEKEAAIRRPCCGDFGLGGALLTALPLYGLAGLANIAVSSRFSTRLSGSCCQDRKHRGPTASLPGGGWTVQPTRLPAAAVLHPKFDG
jgi:hypothetical protein